VVIGAGKSQVVIGAGKSQVVIGAGKSQEVIGDWCDKHGINVDYFSRPSLNFQTERLLNYLDGITRTRCDEGNEELRGPGRGDRDLLR
jgi:hypothetical protein